VDSGTNATGVRTQYRLQQEFLFLFDGFENLLAMREERWETFRDAPL